MTAEASWDGPPLAALARLLREHGMAVEGTLVATPVGNGHVNRTDLVTDGVHRWVVRRPPPPPHPRGAFDVLREVRLLRALEGSAVPVPRVVATARAGEVGDVDLYVMAHVDGWVVTGAVPAPLAQPGDRERIGTSVVEVLADLHAIDPAALGLADLGRPDGFNTRHLRRLDRLLDDPPTTFGPARSWLAERVPAESDARLVHLDHRLGNVIVAPDPPGRVAAVLDWELATIGDPLLDLAFTLWSVPDGHVRTPTQAMCPAALEPGWPTRAALAARYASRSGRDLAGLDWYVVMALYKTAVLYEYSRRRTAAGVTKDAYYADPHHVPAFLREATRVMEEGAGLVEAAR